MLHDDVPAARPLAPRLFVHVTSVTPMSSVALPDTVTVSAFVTRGAAGTVMAMVGALPSDVIETRSVEVLTGRVAGSDGDDVDAGQQGQRGHGPRRGAGAPRRSRRDRWPSAPR